MPFTVRMLASRFREREAMYNVCLPASQWIVLRLDGRHFSALTERYFVKPFDPAFHALMEETARILLVELQGIYVYTGSDEISIVCAPDWDLFDRRAEKLVSLSASIAGVAFSLAGALSGQFDSRVLSFPALEDVCDYFLWRQLDVERCALQTLCYWTLRKAGMSAKKATTALTSAGHTEQLALLSARATTFTASWQQTGVGLFWERYEKTGYNPISQQHVQAVRSRVAVEQELLRGAAYTSWVRGILS